MRMIHSGAPHPRRVRRRRSRHHRHACRLPRPRTPRSRPPSITKMAALGDSITQALMTCSSLSGCPANSWSTGTTPSVNSHLQRLEGCRRDADRRLQRLGHRGAVERAERAGAEGGRRRGAQYVTIEIGANDACTKTVGAMTPMATYKANVASRAGRRSRPARGAPQVFVASVPSLQQLYDVNKGSSSARFTWGLLGICQSMLANPTSTKHGRRCSAGRPCSSGSTTYNAALADLCDARAG